MARTTSVIKVLQSPADSLELAIKSFQRYNESKRFSPNTMHDIHNISRNGFFFR